MIIDRKEALRYMGFGKNDPDERTAALMEECIRETENTAQPRHVYRRFGLKVTEDDYIEAAGLRFHSRNLSKNLTGCGEIIFFAATLGNGVDMLMNRYARLSIAKAAVLQAVAAAAIEAYCNQCQKSIEEKLAGEGLYLRPRFSPGYGDLSIAVQPDFLAAIDASKTVGIVLSEGGVMLPEKSVTAVMGISGENSRCHIEGCEACPKKDCAYRRESRNEFKR